MTELEILRRQKRELQALHELAIHLLRLEDYDAMLDAVVGHALEALGAGMGFLVLVQGTELDFKVVRNWSRDELASNREPMSRSIISEVMRRDEPLLVEDALADPRFDRFSSVLAHQIRSVLAAPLHEGDRITGVLYLESRSLERLFGPDELSFFTRILELSSRALEAAMKRIVLESRNAQLESDLLARHNFQGIVTRDPAFVSVLQTVAQVAPTDMPILIQGPSGTGKELIARALHLNSPRAKRPFLILNCGAISPQLLESELFGHVKGAFTGATSDRMGMIPAADTGTLFLDEIGELPRELQVKLLRTLQFGEVQPVGSTRPQTVNVRFVAATNRDLELEVREGRFREDLLYRLNAIVIELPALAKRPDDILPLFDHFVRTAAEKAARPTPEVTPRLQRMLQDYQWPGNVRELENEAKRLLALTPMGLPLTAEHLSRRIATSPPPEAPTATSLAELEKELVELHLKQAGGNRTQAARSLGISRDGLRKKLKRLGLS